MDKKIKTLEQLQKEGTNVSSNVKLLRNLFLFFIVILVLIIFSTIFFPDFYERIFTVPAEESAYADFVLYNLKVLFGEIDVVEKGIGFISSKFIWGCLICLLQSAAFAYLLHVVLRIFEFIQKGLTPFTLEIAKQWKTCSNFCILFSSFYVLISCNLICLIISSLLAGLFYSLSLIFEYGSALQEESDETL